jgi:hypothetical protein
MAVGNLVKLNLVAIDPDLVSAWQKAFRSFPEVSILEANIISVAKKMLLSHRPTATVTWMADSIAN